MRLTFITHIAAFLVMIFVSAETHASKLHFIIFADTDDSSIGEANQKTYTYLTSSLKPVLSKYSGLEVALYSFYGSECKVSNLDKTLSAMTVGINDVVLFYFIGHGWNRRQSNYPSLIFGNANADRETLETASRDLEDIYKKIRIKNPRFYLVIGEACNKERMDQPQELTSTRPVLIMKPATVDPTHVVKLFNNWRGGIILTSAQRNEFSHSDPKGGWLSIAFQNTMSEMYAATYKGDLTWQRFIDNTRDRTVELAQQNLQEQLPLYNCSEVYPVSPSSALTGNSKDISLETGKLAQAKTPCAPVTTYVNETALSGIREDLPMLTEIYEKINSKNAEEYAETFSVFYKNQKTFYENLGQMVFYQISDIPEYCKPSLQTTTNWVAANAKEVNMRYAVINKYASQPNRLVQQARNDLPSIIRRLEEILEKLDK